MWKQKEATNLLKRFFIFLVFTAQFLETTQTLSDKRLCADINCEKIISLGTGIINYPAGEEGMVSFKINSLIRIKSKSAGSNPSLWGIEVNGREGFAPKKLIRETKIYINDNNLKYKVDVKPLNAAVPNLSTSENSVEHENTVETTSTKPLNVVLAESTEKPLINNSNDKSSIETIASATPVFAETLDGTQNTILGDSENVKKEYENVTVEDDPDKKYKMEMVNHEEDRIKEYDNDIKEDKYVNDQEYQKPAQDLNTDEANINNNAKSSEVGKESVNDVNPKAQQVQNDKIEEIKKENNAPEVSSENNSSTIEFSSKNVKQPEQKSEQNVLENVLTFSQNSVNTDQIKQVENPENLQNSTLLWEISDKNTTEVLNSSETQPASKEEPTNNSNKTQENVNPVEEKVSTLNQNISTENEETNTPEVLSENNSIKTEFTSKNVKQPEQENNKISNELENDTTAAEYSKNTDQAKEVIENLQNSTLLREKLDKNKTEVLNSSKTQPSTKENPTNNSNITLENVKQVEEKAPRFNQNIANEINKENNTPEVSIENNSIKAELSSKNMKQPEQENEKSNKSENDSTASENSKNNKAKEVIENQEDSPNSTFLKEISEKNKTEVLNSSETHPAAKENPTNYPNDILENIKQVEEKAPTLNQNIATEAVIKSNQLLSEKLQESSNEIEDNKSKSDMPTKVNIKNVDDGMQEVTNQINSNLKANNINNNKDNSNITNNLSPSTEVLDVIEPTEQQIVTNVENGQINNNNDLNIQQNPLFEQSYNDHLTQQFENDNQIEYDNKNSLPAETDSSLNQEYSINESTTTESSISFETTEKTDTSGTPPQNIGEIISTTTPKIPEEDPTQEKIVEDNINPTTYNPHEDVPLNTPLPNYANQELPTTTNIPPNDYNAQQNQHVNTESIPTTQQDLENIDKQPKALYSSTSTPFDEVKENEGLFAKIMDTVNNMFINKRHKHNDHDADNDLKRILFSKNGHKQETVNEEDKLQYCKELGPNGDCPADNNHEPSVHFPHSSTKSIFSTDLTWHTFLNALASKILEISELLAFLVIVAATSLFFIFGYYCFCNSSREGALLSKLNQLESSLLASHKENSILKHNLMSTRQKLASIEDNSFGSNDMVVSLRKELEEELIEKARLQEQITVLQKELENAADAGIELNKIVSELLSNQTGDESIISSVEELQKQLNEQQNTILEINASLAEKSRENSELQLLIAEQNARYETELANVQRDNDELEHEKGTLITRLDEMKNEFDKDITAALEGKNLEIKRLQNEIVELTNKLENGHTKWQTSVAKIEALEECLKNVRKDPNVNITEVIDVAYVKAQLIEIQKKYKSLKERLEIELDSKKLAENQLQMVSAEVEKLKQDFNQSENDKLEAQTRLEVLSNYFKDKENQLQKELSLKEAMWLKQQGETTTTVDRVTAMQEEIQSLKSQNDSLRAEIEAQVAAHKAQTGTLENRAHETWLAARQSDRRYEEVRAEATALRRKLTALAGGNVNEAIKPTVGPVNLGDELTQAPSPIHMESPGSPMLGRMPPPPFLPPPFMGPPPPFMGMPPPPPFVPPGEMRPAPLGRIMSPPPQRSGRFSPQHLDYEDYMDYEGNNTWHRHTYSPPPRTYRSLSPTDSRYNYCSERDLMSTYDTETDFSPPPSPRESRRRGGNSSERINSNSKSPYVNAKKNNSSNKGPLSSGSEKSCNTPSHYDTKSKKGNRAGGGGKTLV